MALAAQFAPVLTLQEPDVSSFRQSFDTTSSEETTTSSEESIATNPPTTPHNIIDGGSSSRTSSSRFKRTLKDQLGIPNLDKMDRRGSFWTYPDVGGPFQRVDETQEAINCFVGELQHGARCKEPCKFSHVDRMIHDCKHYLQGPPERDPNSPSSKTTYDEKQYLVQAILDQYNDNNNLSGNDAYELEDLVRRQMICENRMWYHHFNFTTKQKGVDGSTSSKLFFAEVTSVEGTNIWEVSCCCRIEIEDDGGHCYGCINKGSPPMKHPNDNNAYAGGHFDYSPFELVFSSSDDEDNVDKEESDEVESLETDEEGVETTLGPRYMLRKRLELMLDEILLQELQED
uniref:DUF3615 domain-containing protein n=1 Tax=Leersia perrieri TaxID=77586 RepID=A0A0D9XL12_9ORYZ